MTAEENVDRSRTLNVRSAGFILLAYFIVEIIFFVFSYTIGGDRFGLLVDVFMGPIVGIVAVIFVAQAIIPKSLNEAGPMGAAWVPGTRDGIISGLVIGTFVGLCALLLNRFFHSHAIHRDQTIEPIYHAVVTPGI